MAQQTFISRTSPSKSIAPVLTEQYVPFFALPVEIRMMIYVQILRPDCKLASKGGEVYCDENHNHLDRGLVSSPFLLPQLSLPTSNLPGTSSDKSARTQRQYYRPALRPILRRSNFSTDTTSNLRSTVNGRSFYEVLSTSVSLVTCDRLLA